MERTENEQRFELAKAALAGLLNAPDPMPPDMAAQMAVRYADALLFALDNTPRNRGCADCGKTECQCEK